MADDAPPVTKWLKLSVPPPLERPAAPPSPPPEPPPPPPRTPRKKAAAPPPPAVSQERWDLVLRFVDGSLALRGDLLLRGPVLTLGASPGPGGLAMSDYRGIDARQAVITIGPGGETVITPVGTSPVRVSPMVETDWQQVQPLRGPVHLSPGDAIHLGPPGRGGTAIFVEARRLGAWSRDRLISDSADAGIGGGSSRVKVMDPSQGVPPWFVPGLLVVAMFLAGGALISAISWLRRPIPQLGPIAEGLDSYARADAVEVQELAPELKEGIREALHDFVFRPGAEAADDAALARDPALWDPKMVGLIHRSVAAHGSARAFWRRLDQVKDHYAYVVTELQAAGLPLVLAAIPFTESRYKADEDSYVCAMGWWQLMPETAKRLGLAIQGCTLSGSSRSWEPQRLVPVRNTVRRAEYIDRSNGYKCRIEGCEVDERKDTQASTRAAIALLEEAWKDPLLAASGAAVQLTILSHNAGYDDERFDGERRPTNIRPAYERHLRKRGLERDPLFYGANITCVGEGWADPDKTNEQCGGVLPNQTQHYAYTVIAQHILAVCYYTRNYGSTPPFDARRHYDRGDGYCTGIRVPSAEELAR